LAELTDEGDNFQHRKAIVYARNACWKLAKQVGCRYFMQFDDDYTSFHLRHNSKLEYVSPRVKTTMNEILECLLEYFESIPATAIAMAQGGDHIGGGGQLVNGKISGGTPVPRLARKCMNSWLCSAEKAFLFTGHMNEDVSAYVLHGHRGHLFFTVMQAMLVQKPTQITPGGMSDLYLESGTYVKSFYTVLQAPSCTKIGTMGDPRGGTARIHHKINWHNACPKILSESNKKRLSAK